jgi:uncharacterized membrane protein
MSGEDKAWVVSIVGGLLIICTTIALLVGLNIQRGRAFEMAAVNNGLCQVRTVGSEYPVWSTCPR